MTMEGGPADTMPGTALLVAEDNPINQAVAAAMLEALGYHVDIVDTGQEAVEAFLDRAYALIFMDCQMPVMDGYEATKCIREHEARAASGRHIPIIALTAHAMAGDREKCLAAGMDDYVSKPFSQEQLHRLLGRWLPSPAA